MQKLKVYLTKNEESRKSEMKKIKDRMLHSKSYVHEHYRNTNPRSSQKHQISQQQKSKANKHKSQSLGRQIHSQSRLDSGNKKPKKENNKKSNIKIPAYQAIHYLPHRGIIFNSHSKTHHLNIDDSHKNIKQFSSNKLTNEFWPGKSTTKNSSEQAKNKKIKTPLIHTSKHYRSFNQINNYQLNVPIPRSLKRQNQRSLEAVKKNKKRSKSASIQVIAQENSQPLLKQNNLLPDSHPADSLKFKATFRTRKGVQIMNPNKVNQDRFLINQNLVINFAHDHYFHYDLYAVADGHGPCGHHVSNLIIQHLSSKINQYLLQNFNKYFDRETKKNINKQKLEDSILAKTFNKVYSDLQYMLQKNPDFNAEFSGSTLVTILVDRGIKPSDSNRIRITCANVGDSRAIVIRQISKQKWQIIRLSDDHKPSRESERKRIIDCGGRVQQIKDEDGTLLGPLRVWLPKKRVQGLAMSRSLGDNISKPIGVSFEPQILSHQLTSKDKFILLASDGVWQFLSNYQILSLLIPYYQQNKFQQACEALLALAHKSWTTEQNTIVDDITFILIFISEYKTKITQFQLVRDQNKFKEKTIGQFKSENSHTKKESKKEVESVVSDLSEIQVCTNIKDFKQ